jgi:hypothetical protein
MLNIINQKHEITEILDIFEKMCLSPKFSQDGEIHPTTQLMLIEGVYNLEHLDRNKNATLEDILEELGKAIECYKEFLKG